MVLTRADQTFLRAMREGKSGYEYVAEIVARQEAANVAAIEAAARPDEAPSSRGPAADAVAVTSADAIETAADVLPDTAPSSQADATVRAVEPAAIAAAVYPDATESAAAVLPDTAPSSHVDAAVRAVEPASDASASDAASVTEHESGRRPYRGNIGHFRYEERVAFEAFQQARTRN